MCFAASADVTNASSDSKLDLQLKQQIQATTQEAKIPVHIWYKDINRNLVENEVKKATGLTKENVSVLSKDASAETLSYLSKDSDVDAFSAKKTIKEYLEKTKSQRELEKSNVDTYSAAKRNISKEMYKSKSASVINKLGISEEEIKFKSKYTPMIIAELTAEEIEDIAEDSEVESLSLYEEPVASDTTEIAGSQSRSGNFNTPYYDIDMDRFHELFDNETITGNNVAVGVIDSGLYFFNNFDEIPAGNTDYGYVVPQSGGSKLCTNICSVGQSGTGYVTVPHYHVNYNGTPVVVKASECGSLDWSTNCRIHMYGEAEFTNNQLLTNHTTNIIDTIGGFNDSRVGFARGADIYLANYSVDDIYDNIEDMVNNYVDVIVGAVENTTSSRYSSFERWIDELTVDYGLLYINASGNSGSFLNGARTYNGLTVAGCSSSDTEYYGDNQSISDNHMYNGYITNYGNGCPKPDVVAPFGDSSISAAAVTGIVALLFELRPALKLLPDITKAIMLASCTRKAQIPVCDSQGTVTGYTSVSMSQGWTAGQGVGMINAFNALCITLLGQFGTGKVNDASVDNSCISAYGYNNTGINIVSTCYTSSSLNNAMQVFSGTSSTSLGYSNISNSTVQNTSFTLNSGLNNLKVQMQKQGYTGSTTNYAYAWSTTNQEYIDCNDAYGVYRIKNTSNGKYLTMNGFGQFVESNLDFSANQQWIIKSSNSVTMTVQSAYNGLYMSKGTNTTGGMTLVGSLTPETEHMNFSKGHQIKFYSGTPGITPSTYGYVMYAYSLAYDNNGELYWSNTSSTPINYVLERVPYLKGDLNYDGVVDEIDSGLLMNLIQSSTPTGLIAYISDVNKDNAVNINDLITIQNIIVYGRNNSY